MGAEFYDEHVCQHSRKGESSPYKCRCYECRHHAKYVPDGEVEFWEFNPFGKSTLKCPFYQTKAQMIIKSNKKRELDNGELDSWALAESIDTRRDW